MDIQVNYDYRGEFVQGLFDVESLVASILEAEGLPESTEASVSFVDDESIHVLNRDFRGVDRPTDVLSFECDGLDDAFGSAPRGADEPFELGDVFIAVDVAERQAPEYGMSVADEVSLLTTHGMLHLCGYDHMEPDEAETMEAREAVLLSAFWGKAFKRHGLEDERG